MWSLMLNNTMAGEPLLKQETCIAGHLRSPVLMAVNDSWSPGRISKQDTSYASTSKSLKYRWVTSLLLQLKWLKWLACSHYHTSPCEDFRRILCLSTLHLFCRCTIGSLIVQNITQNLVKTEYAKTCVNQNKRSFTSISCFKFWSNCPNYFLWDLKNVLDQLPPQCQCQWSRYCHQ